MQNLCSAKIHFEDFQNGNASGDELPSARAHLIRNPLSLLFLQLRRKLILFFVRKESVNYLISLQLLYKRFIIALFYASVLHSSFFNQG